MSNLEKLFEEVKEKYENVTIINFYGNYNVDSLIWSFYNIKLDKDSYDIVFTLVVQEDNFWDISYNYIKDCSFEVEIELNKIDL